MGLKHNHLAVFGRLYGDDEGTIRLYAGVTESEARQRFSNDLRRGAGARETAVVDEYEFTNVYIDAVLTARQLLAEDRERTQQLSRTITAHRLTVAVNCDRVLQLIEKMEGKQ